MERAYSEWMEKSELSVWGMSTGKEELAFSLTRAKDAALPKFAEFNCLSSHQALFFELETYFLKLTIMVV